MTKNLEVRLLLVLWELGGVKISKGTLNKRFGDKRKEAEAARENLVTAGAISASENGKMFTLTDAGKALLQASLVEDGFEFEAQIGAKMANALLKWWRSRPSASTAMAPVLESPNLQAIESYEAFKSVALDAFERLNRDFNLDNLVPIYRIRRDMGNRVERSQFSEWLFEMQSEDVFQLLEGSVEDNTPDKLEDSVQTKLGKLRCYAKRISA